MSREGNGLASTATKVLTQELQIVQRVRFLGIELAFSLDKLLKADVGVCFKDEKARVPDVLKRGDYSGPVYGTVIEH